MGVPIVTLTSDFGLRDHYVAAMKAAVLEWCPWACLIDVTHEVNPQDVRGASVLLGRLMAGFAPGAVHLAVVDPGVGTRRKLLVARIANQWVVAPDNGLVTWAWTSLGGGVAYELTWRPGRKVSRTFHGRDILGPAAGRLAAGTDVSELGTPVRQAQGGPIRQAQGGPIRRAQRGPLAKPVLLDELRPARAGARRATVIQIDRFGNAMTQMPVERVPAGARFVANGKMIGRLRKTYGDVKAGAPLALIGSSGQLEIAVRNGSAAEKLGLKVGSVVEILVNL